MAQPPFKTDVDHSLKLIHVATDGQLSKEDGFEIITTARSLAAQHHYNILYDVRKSQVLVQLADWFFLPRELEVFQNSQARKVKVAVLISAGPEEENYHFYENVIVNLGMQLKIFLDEAEALNWVVVRPENG